LKLLFTLFNKSFVLYEVERILQDGFEFELEIFNNTA
jgi:hypothetical protein